MDPSEAPAAVQDQQPSPETTDENPAGGQPGGGGGGAEEFSLDSFDATQIPEDADRDWLAERHQALVADYTRKTQGAAEQRREAEQAQAIIQGLSDPQMLPQYLRLLGHDPTDQQFLDALGLEMDAGNEDDLLEELDPNQRIDQLEQQLAAQAQEAQLAQQQDQLEDYMAEQIEALEQKNGSEFSPEEVAFLRRQAEGNPTPNGLPDIEGANKLLTGILDRRVQQELEHRKEAALRPPGTGTPGAKRPDPNTEEGRIQLAQEAVERTRASQQQ